MEDKQNLNDHDLLIELRTEMRGLRIDLKALADGISSRVTSLEQNKLDKVEADRETLRILNLTELKSRAIFEAKTEEDKDHEIRIRIIENNVTKIMTWGSVGLILVGLAQFLIGKYL